MVACLAPDVVFHSPVTFRPYMGVADVGALLRVVFETFEDFRYTDEIEGDSIHALIFKARVGDREVDGLDLLRPGADGKIADFTVMVRPLSAAIALAERVGKGLAEHGVATTGAA